MNCDIGTTWRASVDACHSYPQHCSLGPLPPRTPARPDPQVPGNAKLGPCRYGKIGSVYFYDVASQQDPLFGFVEIELSIQRIAEDLLRLELYCIADGYQSAGGNGSKFPLKIAAMAGENVIATTEWAYPPVVCGHADPMTFAVDLPVDATAFAKIDRVEIQKTKGEARLCG